MTGYLEGFDSTFEFLHFVRPLIRFASRHKLTTPSLLTPLPSPSPSPSPSLPFYRKPPPRLSKLRVKKWRVLLTEKSITSPTLARPINSDNRCPVVFLRASALRVGPPAKFDVSTVDFPSPVRRKKKKRER